MLNLSLVLLLLFFVFAKNLILQYRLYLTHRAPDL